MKIVLVNLPWKKAGSWGVRAGSRWPHIKTVQEDRYTPFPFFLAYAAALLRKEGFQVRLIDALAQRIPLSAFLKIVAEEKPDLLVAETSTPSLDNDLKILSRLSSGIPLALCGPEANIREAGFLSQNKFIDYVFTGEYEFTLLELARELSGKKQLHGITGLIYRDGSGVKTNPPRSLISDLDVLPWPLREDLPMAQYNDTPGGIPGPSVQMWASRGCPYQCSFCLWPQLMYQKGRYRVRAVIEVVNEMEHLVKNLGFKSVYFDDDTFNIGKLRMLEFAKEIKSRKLGIPWAMMARADLMDEELLESLRASGLSAVKYGVESAQQSLVDSINKNMDLGKVERMIKFTNSLGIKTHLTFTFGLPGETRETIQKTIDFALRLDPDSAQFSITTAFPGTRYFQDLEGKGYILSRDPADYDGNSRGMLRTDALGREELESAKRLADKTWQMHVLNTRLKQMPLNTRLGKLWKNMSTLSCRMFLNKLVLFIETKSRGLKPVLKQKNGLSGNRLVKFKDFLKYKGPLSTLRKIKREYLDILGVFNGSFAFKGPDCVQIDLTSNCNNNCIGCWCNSPLLGDRVYQGLRKFQSLPTDMVLDLIGELAKLGTRELYFSGGGEPFMHPDILEIVSFAKSRGLSCAINTNFTLVDRDAIRRLIALEVDQLTVSVWAGTPRTYAATHPNKNEETFRRIQSALTMLNSLKKKSRPYIKIYHVISNINYQEIDAMVEFAHNTGSEAVEFTVIDTIPQATDRLLLSARERSAVLDQCEDISRRYPEVRILNLEHFRRRLTDLGSDKAQYDSSFIENMPCYVGWLFARIMPNGDVNSCLKSHRIPVGNLYDKSFGRIWNSPLQTEFRQKGVTRKKNDPFFALIGNDPECKVGCQKSCDDIGRNLIMHEKMRLLKPKEIFILRHIAKACKCPR